MLIRHGILYTIAKLIPGILGLVTTGILTRLLDPQGYGLYGFILVIMALISTTLFEWLLSTFLRLYEARRSDPRTVATFVRIYLLIMPISGVATLLVFEAVDRGTASLAVCLLGIVVAWTYSWFEFTSQIEIVNFRPINYLKMNVSRAAAVLIGAVGAAWWTRDPFWTAAAMGAGFLFGTTKVTREIFRHGIRYFDPGLAKEIFAFGLPLAASKALNAFIGNGTRLLVGMLNSATGLGLYTASFLLVQNSLTVIASGVSTAGYQLAVRAVDGDDPEAKRRQIRENGAFLLAVLAPMCLGMALTARGIALVCVGVKFRASVIELTPWMAAGGFFMNIRSFYLDSAFQLGNRPGLQAWVTAMTAVISLILGIVLIPRFGPLGGAISVTATMFVSCCIAAMVGRWAYPMQFPLHAAARVFLSCLVMTAVVLSIPGEGSVTLLFQVVLGAVAYAVTAFVLDLLGARSRLIARLSRQGA